MTVSKFCELLTLWKLAANAKFQHNFTTIMMPDRQKKIIYCIRIDSTFDKAAPGADFLNFSQFLIIGLLFIGLLNSNVFRLH